MDLREAGLISGSIADHWYYRAKSAAVEAALGGFRPGTVLDVGAGSGFFSRQLLRHPHIRAATCVDPCYDGDRDETHHGKKLLFRRRVERPRADLVLLMDVLEHVEHDAELLGHYVGQVDEGTCFVITVPAFSWLWSSHDVFLGHYRRYALGEICRVAETSGLCVERCCYLYGGLFAVAASSRLLGWLSAAVFGDKPARSHMRRPHRLVNRVLWLICRAELAVFRHNRLFGLTAMVVATKRAQSA